MFVLMLPMIVGFTLLGCVTGAVVGQKLWGKFGAVILAMLLGLFPAVVGLVVGMGLLWNSNLLKP
jgi:hypothetical protein